MTRPKPAHPLVVNGWTLYAHPLFLAQLSALIRDVERLRAKDSQGYKRKNATKRLAAIWKLALETIPQEPTRADYRLGETLGAAYKHWHRAKFFQQYRLFFRYHAATKVIVYAWVNDEDTRRAYESADDAYRVFRKMLVKGNPPDNWEELVAAVQAEAEALRNLATASLKNVD